VFGPTSSPKPKASMISVCRTPLCRGRTLAATLALGLVSALQAAPVAAQEIRLPAGSTDQRVDGIAAVVGDSVIFRTDVEEQILRLQARGATIPTAAEARRVVERDILEGLVNQQILLQAALRDSTITIGDDRVESTLRLAWDEEIRRWGTEAALRDELERSQRLTILQYRAQLREEIRRDLLVQTFLQARRREARPVPVSDAEVEAFFQSQRDQLTRRPATLTFQQIFVQPSPGDSVMTAAREEIERILGLLREGEDFASLARQFSDDPGSRQQGGDIGWYRRGDGLVQEFEDAAFRLREGGIVGPVETMFGAHLIQVERVRGAERRIRHILIAAPIAPEDLERARGEAESVRAQLLAGAPVRPFTEKQRGQGITDSIEVPIDQLRQLPEVFSQQLTGAPEGAVVGPVEFPLGQNQPAWAIFKVLRVREEGAFTLEDLRSQIRERLQQEKAETRMIESLRESTFVEIRL
jgi:peptidyl-prolyl cis-trans isomerase SurA